MVRRDRLGIDDVNRQRQYLTHDRQVAGSTFNRWHRAPFEAGARIREDVALDPSGWRAPPHHLERQQRKPTPSSSEAGPLFRDSA